MWDGTAAELLSCEKWRTCLIACFENHQWDVSGQPFVALYYSTLEMVTRFCLIIAEFLIRLKLTIVVIFWHFFHQKALETFIMRPKLYRKSQCAWLATVGQLLVIAPPRDALAHHQNVSENFSLKPAQIRVSRHIWPEGCLGQARSNQEENDQTDFTVTATTT